MSVAGKILVIDLETAPNLSYHWRMFDENISIGQVVEPGRILCFAAKFVGEPMQFYSEWDDGQAGMLAAAHELLSEADAVVTYNGDKFDIPWLLTEMLKRGYPMPPPITTIDLYKTVRNKLKFLSNKLEYVAPYLGVGRKVKHEGFDLWKKVLLGEKPAQRRMQRYCVGDVRVTERLYLKIRPYIVNHPHMTLTKGADCGACGSSNQQSRGWRRTKSFRIQRLQCQNCGSWHDGIRQKVT